MNTALPNNFARAASFIAAAAVATFVVACAGSSQPGWTYMPLPPTSPPASGSPGTSGSPAASSTAAPSAPGSPASSGSPATSGSPAPSGSPAASGSPGASGSAAANVVELEETSSLQIVQNGQQVTSIPIVAGQTYTFRVTNSAGFDHNLYLGPADRLAAGDTTGLPGVPTFQSGTQEFTWTADATATGWQFGCLVPGHFTTMHGDLSLTP